MSVDDLRRLGVLVEWEEWSPEFAATRVPIVSFVALAVIAAAGCLVMTFSHGGWWTWIGLAAFLIGLFGLTAVNVKGVDPSPPGSRVATSENSDGCDDTEVDESIAARDFDDADE